MFSPALPCLSLESSAHKRSFALFTSSISGIIGSKGCAECIDKVLSMQPDARLIRAGGCKNSASEMTMVSVKSPGALVKRAMLIVLFDRFAIVSLKLRIYESATCRVYRAEDLETGRVVALKVGFLHFVFSLLMQNWRSHTLSLSLSLSLSHTHTRAHTRTHARSLLIPVTTTKRLRCVTS